MGQHSLKRYACPIHLRFGAKVSLVGKCLGNAPERRVRFFLALPVLLVGVLLADLSYVQKTKVDQPKAGRIGLRIASDQFIQFPDRRVPTRQLLTI